MRPLIAALLGFNLFACSGGTSTVDAGVLPDGAVLPDGGCPVPSSVLENVAATALQLAGDDLVFMDEKAGPPFLTANSRAIRKVKVDGTGDVVLHTAAMGFQINDLFVSGSTIYFLESERLMSGAEQTRVYSLPVAGGMPTLIQLHDDPSNGFPGDRLDAIVAVDSQALYLVRNILSPASLFRMPLAGGAETIVTEVGIHTRPQLLGSDLYFTTTALPMNGYYGIGKVPTSGSMAMPTQVGTAFCKGDLAVGAWGLACAGAQETMTEKKISKFDPMGAGHQEIFGVEENVKLQIGPSDGTHVWVTGNQPSTNGKNLYKVPLAGGAAIVAACDRRTIDPRGGGGNNAYSASMEMVLSATSLYWIETRREATGDRTSIYRAPK